MTSRCNLICGVCSKTEADLECPCTSPPLPICSPCLLVHLRKQGKHLARAAKKDLPPPQIPSSFSVDFPSLSANLRENSPRKSISGQEKRVKDPTIPQSRKLPSEPAVLPKPVSIPPPPPKPKILNPCDECGSAEAAVVTISPEELPLKCCEGCAKNYSDYLPLSSFKKLKDNRIITFAVEKFKYAEKIRKQIQVNITRIDNFVEKVNERFRKMTRELEECKTRLLQRVAEARTDISSKLASAVADIESHLCDNSFSPSEEYSQILWEPRIEDVNFDLFVSRWESPPDLISEITRKLDFELKGIFALNCIPVVSDTHIVKFNCKSQEWRPPIKLKKPVKVSEHTVMTYLGGQDVLCSGYLSEDAGPSAESFIVNIATGEVKLLPAMETPRYHHGSAWIGRNVYVFGGQNSADSFLNSCEQYSLDQGRDVWGKSTKDMIYPRACFNPMVKGEYVYLFGGTNTKDAEMFDYLKSVFIPLCIVLPCKHGVSAIFLPPNVLIFQKNKVHIWEPNNKLITYKSSTRGNVGDRVNAEDEDCGWSNFTPLVVGFHLYLLSLRQREITQQEVCGRYDFSISSFN